MCYKSEGNCSWGFSIYICLDVKILDVTKQVNRNSVQPKILQISMPASIDSYIYSITHSHCNTDHNITISRNYHFSELRVLTAWELQDREIVYKSTLRRDAEPITMYQLKWFLYTMVSLFQIYSCFDVFPVLPISPLRQNCSHFNPSSAMVPSTKSTASNKSTAVLWMWKWI